MSEVVRPKVRRATPILLGLIWLLLICNWVFAIGRFQSNLLVLDQWDFFSPVFDGDGIWRTFTYQHGPHRQGLAFVITSWIYQATAWDARFDSLWVASLIGASALLALRLKWKLTGTLGVSDVWILLLLMSLRQFEPVLITPNASHGVFPLFLLLLICNTWLSQNLIIRYGITAISGWMLTFSGFGMFGSIALLVILAADMLRQISLRDRRRAAVAAVALVTVASSWAAFLPGYSYGGALDGTAIEGVRPADCLRFVVLMLGHLCGMTSGSLFHHAIGSLIGMAVLVMLGVALRRMPQARAHGSHDDVLLLLLLTGICFVGATTLGRVQYGTDAGLASRYLPLLFTIPLAAFFAAKLHGRRRMQFLAGVTLWLATLAPYAYSLARAPKQWPGTLGLRDGRLRQLERASNGEAIWAYTFLQTADLNAAQQAAGWLVYPPENAERLGPRLAFLSERKLSFFSSPAHEASFLPWFVRDRVLWDDALERDRSPRILERDARLAFIGRRAGFAEIQFTSTKPSGPPETPRHIQISGEFGDVSVLVTPPMQTVFLPVHAGVNRFTFEHEPVVASGDTEIRISRVRWISRPTGTDRLPQGGPSTPGSGGFR